MVGFLWRLLKLAAAVCVLAIAVGCLIAARSPQSAALLLLLDCVVGGVAILVGANRDDVWRVSAGTSCVVIALIGMAVASGLPRTSLEVLALLTGSAPYLAAVAIGWCPPLLPAPSRTLLRVAAVVAATVPAIVAASASIELYGIAHVAEPPQQFALYDAVLLALIAGYILGAFSIATSLRVSFRSDSQNAQLWVILASYASLILLFAAIYYGIAGVFDRDDVQHRDLQRTGQLLMILGESDPFSDRDTTSLRPFNNLEPSLWRLSKQEEFQKLIAGGTSAANQQAIRAFLQLRDCDTVSFEGQHRLALFGNCLHFSVVTATTLGYGDITPATWYAKALVDLQVLAAVAIGLFALATFGKSRLGGGRRQG